jgi:twinkle protein
MASVNHNEQDSEFVRHLPCPSCGSSDANSLYTDGHEHCFTCNRHTFADGEVQQTSAPAVVLPGEVTTLKSRGLTAATCQKFGVRLDVAKKRIILPYHDDTGRLVAYKSKYQDKTHPVTGDLPGTLFGQHLFGGGKSIVITEGELDALAVWQCRPNWPVVSVPLGAKAAKKAIQANLKYLLNFEEIILFFDNDDAGQAAAQECAPLLPGARTFIATAAPLKDANEALLSAPENVRQAIWNRRPWRPAAVVAGESLFTLISAPLRGRDALWPYSQLNELTGGLRRGELVTLTAGTGVGKSTFCGETAQSLVQQGEKIGYVALEESLQRAALRLTSIAANRPLHIDNTGIPPEDLRKAFDASVGSGRVVFNADFRTVDPVELLNELRFMVMAEECHWLFVDHLSILISGNDDGDERKLIDLTMTRLRNFVEETDCGMILISHLTGVQGGGKSHESGGRAHLNQLRGSRSIGQLSDIVVALERDLEEGENGTLVRVLKNRHNGRTGPAGKVCYNSATGRMVEDHSSFFPESTTEESPF